MPPDVGRVLGLDPAAEASVPECRLPVPAPVQPIAFDRRYDRQLALLFSGPVLRELARSGASRLVTYTVAEAAGTDGPWRALTYGEVFEACYAHLWAHYRAEYVYKNVIATKILLGRHSPTTSALLPEFRVEQAKADAVIINGTSTAYEIKTELDNLDRLPSQLAAYCKVLDRVFVVTHPSLVDRVAALADTRVGILALTPRGSLRTVRPAASNAAQVCPGTIFDSLRRSEYIHILRQVFGDVPHVPNTRMYRECRRLFETLAPEVAHAEMVKVLRARRVPAATAAFLTRAPGSLKALALTTPLSPTATERLEQVLGSPTVGGLKAPLVAMTADA